MQYMHFSLVSIMPDMFDAVKNYGVIGRAVKRGLIKLSLLNPRDYSANKNFRVDDRPYGGGPGMVMQAEPIKKAINAAKANDQSTTKVILLTPHGKQLDQKMVEQLSETKHLVLVSGRYEGIDHRIQTDIDLNISIGDYILSGGELASMVLIDAVSRLLTDILGHKQSAVHESFSTGLLDYPQYTRPINLNGYKVPEILLSGNHKKIAKWRIQQSLGITWLLRPDLLAKVELSEDNKLLLQDFIQKYHKNNS